MANIRKSFNLRNGVQVDDKDFIVKGSLVGIGTSVPTELFDVRGNAKFTGLSTFANVYVSGVTTFSDTIKIGTAVTISASGIITATSFYGNGATLLNLPTSQWQDVDVGLGFTSIYAVGNVGIATRDPRYVFQVGQVNLYQAGLTNRSGLGINSQGGVISSGIISAFSFVGLGSFISSISADNVTLGTLSNSRLPILAQDRFPNDLTISGTLSAGNRFSGTLYGNVVGIASTAYGLGGNPDIYVGLLSATSIVAKNIQITGDVASPIPGISTVGGLFNVGSGGTAFSASINAKVGIGTSNPLYSLSIARDTNAAIELTSASGSPRISVGSSVGQGNMAGYLRWDPYATRGNFDVANKSTGDLTFTLHSGNSGINTGNWNWIYGQTNNPLMTLTYGGRLGIGITNPSGVLHVAGISSFNNIARFGASIECAGTVTYNGSYVLGDPASYIGQNTFVQSGVSTFANVVVGGGNSLGIGTARPIVGLDARAQTALINNIGVSTDRLALNSVMTVNGNVIVGTTPQGGAIGLGTTTPYSDPFVSSGSLQIFGSNLRMFNADLIITDNGKIGIGTNQAVGSLDMRYASFSQGGTLYRGWFTPPNLTDAERTTINPVLAPGAVIYNSSVNQFQGYNGATWFNFATAGAANDITLSRLTVTGVGTINSLIINAGQTVAGVLTASTLSAAAISGNGVNVSGATTTQRFSSGAISANGVNVSGICTATTFSGSGASLTSIPNSATTATNTNTASAIVARDGSGNFSAGSGSFSGTVTGTTGFISGVGTAVQITTVGNRLVFTVPGVGTTSLQLF